jgi:acetyl esterase
MTSIFILILSCLPFRFYPAMSSEIKCSFQDTAKNMIVHEREIYKTVDTFKLKVDVFYSKMAITRENNTAIVFFHGGGWAYGTPDEFFTTCERYAKMGIVTFSVDYRLSVDKGVRPSKTISPIECIMDARSAMRWVRANAGKYHIGKNRIVAAGQSAGGHLALSTAMIDNYNEKTDNLSINSRPDAILLFSSCVNTLEAWCDRMLSDRRDKIWSISPAHNIRKGLPPMIEFHGDYDDQVPVWTVRSFADEMVKAGNYFELHIYQGKRHYLGDGNPKYSRYFDDEILKLTDAFLRKYSFLE